MAKVSNLQTAAASEVAETAAPVVNDDGVTILDARSATVIDDQRRVIKVRRLSAIDRMRLMKLCGAEHSDNAQLMGFATLAYAVTEIAVEHVATPTSYLQIEAIVARLDDDGLIAVAKALKAITPGMGVDRDEVKN